MKKSPLPAEFVSFVQGLVLGPRPINPRRVFRGLIIRWSLWQDGHDDNRLPGYATCPPEDARTGFPAGWSQRAIMDLCREAIGTDAIRTARRRAAALSA